MFSSQDELLLNANISAVAAVDNRVYFRLLEHYLSLPGELTGGIWLTPWDQVYDNLKQEKPLKGAEVTYLQSTARPGTGNWQLVHPTAGEIDIHKIVKISRPSGLRKVEMGTGTRTIVELGERFIVADYEFGEFTPGCVMVSFAASEDRYGNAYFSHTGIRLGR